MATSKSTAASIVDRATVSEFKNIIGCKTLSVVCGSVTNLMCVQTDKGKTVATVSKSYDDRLNKDAFVLICKDGKQFWCLCNDNGSKVEQDYVVVKRLK
jgi:hypothetical protein